MKYDTLANGKEVEAVIAALGERGMTAEALDTGLDALKKVKSLIPKGVSVMNGSSITLQQIGFIDYLTSGVHGWDNLHVAILAEKDPGKQAALRKQSVLSDYYVGSVHAIAKTGELVVASASGSQLPNLVYTSPNIILVAGTHKIVPTLQDALKRIEDYVFPLEDKRMKEAGYPGSLLAKILIMAREHPMMGRKVHLILVNEILGF